MTVHTLQVSGARGEITPLMHSRVDTELYQAGLAIARNVYVTRYGALGRIPGTLHRGRTKLAGRKARLLQFAFNEDQVYAMEFGHLYVRFWTRNGYVAVGGVPYEIVSPYTEDMLDSIHVIQSGDVVYVFGGGLQPRLLTRRGETDWAFSLYRSKDGPYLDINETSTTLTPANNGAMVPRLTSNTWAGGSVASTDAVSSAFQLFDDRKNRGVIVSKTSEGDVTITLSAGTAAAADAYWLTAAPDNPKDDDMMTQWTIEASDDGINWATLDSRDGETGWAGSETRFFEFSNKAAYRYWRLSGSGGGGADGINTTLAEFRLNRTAEDQTPFNLTASSTAGINDGVGFLTSDVGRSIRLYGEDGQWRWAEIVSRVSATRVTIRLHGQGLPSLSPINLWRMGAFSDHTGWPTFGRFYEDRLVMTGVKTDPLGIWMSVIAGYDLYRLSSPSVDDDAITLRLTGGRFSRIHWLAEAGTLLIGTGAALRSLAGRDQSAPLSNTNVRQRSETAVPASDVLPVEVESVVLFIDMYRKRLYETAFSYESDGFVARELSILNEHLFAVGIDQIEWLDTPHKLAVCRRDDGKLVMFAYDREQKIAGATLVDFGGVVEDIMSMPGPDGMDLFLVVKRGDDRFVELLAPFWRSDIHTTPPVYAASSFVYQGPPVTQLTGLDFLEGEDVGVWADGRDLGDALVTGGVVNVPYGASASNIVVGLRMPWVIQTLRLSNHGQQDGSGFGRSVKILNASVDLFETAGISAGSLNEVDTVRFEADAEENPDMPVPLRSGMVKLPVDDSWQNNGVFVIEGDSMYPATVRGISLHVDGEP